MKPQISQPIKGARDFYPQDFAIREWLFSQWRKIAQSFGYQEIDGPILESFDLFAAKSGEELVNKQMYFLTDRGGRKLGIRPELTPTYSRMVARRQNELVFPLRWMMIGDVWRYEQPQKGRGRQFWQWEINIVGGDEILADTEILTIAAKALEAVGLTSDDVVFRINDRQFMKQQLKLIGIEENKYLDVFKAIDKKERINKEDYQAWLKEIGLTDDQTSQLNNFLESASFESSSKLKKLFDLLQQYGVSEYVQYDPLIVRGLDYYTGVVFECFDKKMGLRSIFGGGRFDDLVETFGGDPVPAQGFAIGDMVIIELLKKLDRIPKLNPLPTKVLITIFSPDLLSESIKIANLLRENNISTELYPDGKVKLDKQLKYADQKGIPYAIIIGPKELQNKSVIVKNLEVIKQSEIKIKDLLDFFKQKV